MSIMLCDDGEGTMHLIVARRKVGVLSSKQETENLGK